MHEYTGNFDTQCLGEWINNILEGYVTRCLFYKSPQLFKQEA